MEVAMLEEAEWRIVQEHMRNRALEIQELPSEPDTVLDEDGFPIDPVFQAALDAYKRITGFHETNFAALAHHFAALYGPPCHKCGRPLRTPQARLCGSCMAPRAV